MSQKLLVITFILLLLAAGCGLKKGSRLEGEWQVDPGESIRYIRSTPVWDQMSEDEQLIFPDVFEEMATIMRYTFREDKMISNLGNQTLEVPYEVVSESKDQLEIVVSTEDRKVRLTFYFLEKGLMRFTSDATSELDYYVWKKSDRK